MGQLTLDEMFGRKRKGGEEADVVAERRAGKGKGKAKAPRRLAPTRHRRTPPRRAVVLSSSESEDETEGEAEEEEEEEASGAPASPEAETVVVSARRRTRSSARVGAKTRGAAAEAEAVEAEAEAEELAAEPLRALRLQYVEAQWHPCRRAGTGGNLALLLASRRVRGTCCTSLSGRFAEALRLRLGELTLARSAESRLLSVPYNLSYGLDGDMVAAGGHGGMIQLVRTGDPIDGFTRFAPPYVTIAAHDRWVSGVEFVRHTDRFVSVSDDATLRVWKVPVADYAAYGGVEEDWSEDEVRVVRARDGTHLLHTAEGVHAGGIYSLSLLGDCVATSSKDELVALGKLGGAAYSHERYFSGHTGVVKAVRMRDAHVLASTGNDGQLLVHDARLPAAASTVFRVEQAHRRAANSVEWDHAAGTRIMTASFDGRCKIFDIRGASAAPLLDFAYATGAISSISKPVFFADATAVAFAVADTNKVVLHDATAGRKAQTVAFDCKLNGTLALHAASGRLCVAGRRRLFHLHNA